MADKKYIMCYDHGTSGMKTAIISTRGDILGFSVKEYGLKTDGSLAEQSPDDWWKALVESTHDLLSKNLISVDQIAATVMSNMMCGTIPIDKDGQRLMDCMMWLDTRGAPIIEKLFGGPISGYSASKLLKWLPLTGGIPGLAGKDIIAHILWIKEHKPEIYERTYKFLDAKDYLNYRLSGQIATCPDCGIFSWIVNTKDANNFFFDPELVKVVKIDTAKLPEWRKSIDILGTLKPDVAKELGLKPETKVINGTGDIAAAAVGSGAVLENQTHCCVGSSSWFVAHSPIRRVDPFHTIGSVPSAIPGQFMTIGEQEAAGINLTWLRDKILYNKDALLQSEKVPDVYKIFDKLVEEVPPGSNRTIFCPWMFGERTPIEDHTIRGALHNISLDTDRRHIIRAVFEGIAFNSRWFLFYLEKLMKTKLNPITMVGGGAMSKTWCQIYANILNKKILQVAHPKESNSLGCAFIGGVALGDIQWSDIPNLVKIKAEFLPQKEHLETYNKLFKEFTMCYNQNKAMYRRLNFHH